MDKEIGKYLFDIANCILEIDNFFEDKTKSFQDYQKDVMLKRAVERNLEIIGEAINRILKKQPDIEISNSRQIVQFRNLVIHAYDSISDEIVWAIIINHLPVLKDEIKEILEKEFPNYPGFD